MNISEPFIRRPIATSLLMAGVVLMGLLGYFLLPVSALPPVDFPTIQVTGQFPGAGPDVMASSVTTPLERQFGQISGLSQMTSISSFGNSSITLQFDLDRDIDAAAQDVQAAMNAANGVLPQMPNPPTYSKVNPADTPILTLAITSDTLPLEKVNDLADTVLAQKLSEVSGVGLVTIEGNQKPAVRVRVNPSALASLGLGFEDIRSALIQNNINAPKGSFDGARQAYSIGANDQIFSAAEYANVIVAYRNGSPVRLRDLGEVVDNVENVRLAGWVGQRPAVILDIQRQPGANIIETADRVKALLPRLRASIPPSMKVSILTDRTETIRASVRDVQFTLLLTVGLVVMVIFVFLRKLWATVIPSVALPLAVIGTFGVMKLIGFSLDNLSLMALTISTGFVVDDAIVMIENIVRFIESGRAADAGGVERGQADRVHRRFAKLFARGGVHSADLHDRHRRAAVPRIRHHLEHRGDGVGRRVADADADDVLRGCWSRRTSRSTAGSFALTERFFKGHARRLRTRAAMGAAASAVRAGRGRGDAGGHDLALCRGAQRAAAAAGHRFDPGHHGCRADDFLQSDGGAAAPGGGDRDAKTRTW